MAGKPRNSNARYPSACTKYSLGILCLSFCVIAIILIGCGAFVLHELKDYIKELTDLQFQPSILFIIVGILMFLITFVGFIGAVRENITLLKIYIIALLVIIFIVVGGVAAVFVFRAKLEEKVTTKIKTWIPLYNSGDKHLDIQNIMDQVQSELSCCGATNADDWNANKYFDCNSDKPIPSRCGVPFSCCKSQFQSNRHCGYGVRDTSKLTLQEKTKKLSEINYDGCVQKGIAFLSDNWLIFGGVAIGFFVLLVVSMCLANNLREDIIKISKR